MEPRDEYFHDFPEPLSAHWKENWYFNFIDRERKAWGINHISLLRHRSQGRFSAFHVIDDEVLMYSNLIDIGDEMQELTDGRLKFEFIEPGKRCRVTFHGPRHSAELDYQARFPVFDYAPAGPVKKGGQKALAVNHYEQAMKVKGQISIKGETRKISCLGHRDHSWGYRNESKVTSWNWVAVQFPDRTINLSRVVIGKAFMGSGFVSTKDGNSRMVRVSVEDTRFENDSPVSSVFTGVDEAGRVCKLKSEKFSGLYLPMKEKGEGVVIHENFSRFQDIESGETGTGIDEYLINPEG